MRETTETAYFEFKECTKCGMTYPDYNIIEMGEGDMCRRCFNVFSKEKQRKFEEKIVTITKGRGGMANSGLIFSEMILKPETEKKSIWKRLRLKFRKNPRS